MFHFDEDLAAAHFEQLGYFVRANVPYRPARGGNDSDVDLVVMHPVTGDAAAVEVKGWHTEQLTMSYWKDWPGLLNFAGPEATQAVSRILGREEFRRVLVCPRLGPRDPDAATSYAAERGVELLEWPELLRGLIDVVDVRKSALTPTAHVLRVLKAYGLLNHP